MVNILGNTHIQLQIHAKSRQNELTATETVAFWSKIGSAITEKCMATRMKDGILFVIHAHFTNEPSRIGMGVCCFWRGLNKLWLNGLRLQGLWLSGLWRYWNLMGPSRPAVSSCRWTVFFFIVKIHFHNLAFITIPSTATSSTSTSTSATSSSTALATDGSNLRTLLWFLFYPIINNKKP